MDQPFSFLKQETRAGGHCGCTSTSALRDLSKICTELEKETLLAAQVSEINEAYLQDPESHKRRRLGEGSGLETTGDVSSFRMSESKSRIATAGDRTLSALFAKLEEIDGLSFPRSHHQIKFHDCFVRACLRIIYGVDYERCEQQLKNEFDVDEFRTEVMIVTPRRFGKTFSVAQYCAAFATSVLGKEVAIFSTGRRASKKILDLVERFLKPILRPTQKIEMRNVEEIHIRDSETGLLNKVCSYPSKVQTLKGSGGDLIVCEEAAYMDQQVFYEVVVPLLGLRDTALIAISTILDPSNFYTKLVDMKDKAGNSLFDVQRFELVCEACKKTSTPWKCTHMTDTLPPWLSEDKHAKIRNFLPPELIGRETMGITMSDSSKAFEPTLVESFVKASPAKLPRSVFERIYYDTLRKNPNGVRALTAEEFPSGAIYVAVDPSGGGASEYAIASVMHYNGFTTVRAPCPRRYATAPGFEKALPGRLPASRSTCTFVWQREQHAGSFATQSSRTRTFSLRRYRRSCRPHCCAVVRLARQHRLQSFVNRRRTEDKATTAKPTAAAPLFLRWTE